MRTVLLAALRDPEMEDVAKTLLSYVAMTGQMHWQVGDLATDLGWKPQRVGYAARILVERGLVERERRPIMGGWTTFYSFKGEA